jgi:hypothetical protein
LRTFIARIACLLSALVALGACDVRPVERCDGTGRLNLSLNGYVFHVKNREISAINFWNQMRPPAILEAGGYKQPQNCRSDRYGKGPVEVGSFSAEVGGPNGLLLNFQSAPHRYHERPSRFDPIESAQIKAIRVGKPERVGSGTHMLPLEFELHDGSKRQWSTRCTGLPLPDDPDTLRMTLCHVLLPLRGGPWLMISTGGARPDQPDKIRQLERDIVVGLNFAEQLQVQSERANRREWE